MKQMPKHSRLGSGLTVLLSSSVIDPSVLPTTESALEKKLPDFPAVFVFRPYTPLGDIVMGFRNEGLK
jgi:hypothetical protein